jgi:outer membrane protein OmpA-like peptidoglycan-associated protein
MRGPLLLLLIVSSHWSLGQTFCLSDSILQAGAIYRPKVYFPFNGRAIAPESYPLLDSLAAFLIRQKPIVVELGAYADSATIKQNEYCCKVLYVQQGRSVFDYLIAKGVDSNRLQWKNYGYRRPKTRTGKSNISNTRLEFKIIRINKG